MILAVFYASSIKAVGLNHGLSIGFVAGLLSFVPYLGSLTGLIVSLAMTVVQFGLAWPKLAKVVAIFLVGHLVGDYVLAPRLVGREFHLNPVWLMFALFAFGYLFGFFGLLVAVPLAAAVGVLCAWVGPLSVPPTPKIISRCKLSSVKRQTPSCWSARGGAHGINQTSFATLADFCVGHL